MHVLKNKPPIIPMRQEMSIESVAGDAWLDELHSGTEPRVVFIFDMQPKRNCAQNAACAHTPHHTKNKKLQCLVKRRTFSPLFSRMQTLARCINLRSRRARRGGPLGDDVGCTGSRSACHQTPAQTAHGLTHSTVWAKISMIK